MIARCLDPSLTRVEKHAELVEFLAGEAASPADRRVPLEAGVDYLVAAAAFGPSVPWFFVLDRASRYRVPIPAPCLHFDVRDSSVSAPAA